MIMKMNKQFIREYATKEAMETAKIEVYIFICKLLEKELVEISQKDKTSS